MAPAAQDVNRAIGEHDAEIRNLRREVSDLNSKVDEVLRIMHEAQGGWRTLVWVGSLSGSIGAGLAWLATKFLGGLFR